MCEYEKNAKQKLMALYLELDELADKLKELGDKTAGQMYAKAEGVVESMDELGLIEDWEMCAMLDELNAKQPKMFRAKARRVYRQRSKKEG